MDQEQREKFDRLLVRETMTPNLPVERARRAPLWWKGESEASASNIAAARQLGFQVMEQT